MNTIHIKKLWQGEYVFSERDNYSRESWCVGLQELIEKIFNEKTLTIYKF